MHEIRHAYRCLTYGFRRAPNHIAAGARRIHGFTLTLIRCFPIPYTFIHHVSSKDDTQLPTGRVQGMVQANDVSNPSIRLGGVWLM
jgi:hypothetical protein